MERLLVLLSIVIIFAVVFGLMFIYYRQQHSYRRLKWTRRGSSFMGSERASQRDRSNGDEVRIEQVAPKLQKRLLLLLHGDRKAANRLLSAAKERNPGKSIQWCAEKVLFDIQRDHGKY